MFASFAVLATRRLKSPSPARSFVAYMKGTRSTLLLEPSFGPESTASRFLAANVGSMVGPQFHPIGPTFLELSN